MIELKNVSKVYKTKKGIQTKALDNINLKLGNAGMTFIVGKSGSGKSTLLNLLGGLDNVTSGEVLINNQNISKFKNRQYDAYRNTYIGFIFQEFNVLEQYNVYENIDLALRLQNKKSKPNEINDLLKKLGIENLEQRKINELSGGQKQRVAIARALIKNPQVILADEPTGNLDQSSSTQIFELLKEISKEKLVIVVSHDTEAANKYADRIIELSDGKIVNDTNKIEEKPKEELNLKKSKLPISYSLKLAIKNLKVKPLKLLMTIILTAMALIFMGFTINILIFDKVNFITNTMEENEEFVYSVDKTEYYGMADYKLLELDDTDINSIQKITNSSLNLSYRLYENSNLLTFEFGDSKDNSDYFNSSPIITNYVEITDSKIINKLIGTLPSNDKELVIHKYLADYMMKNGVVDSNNEIYKPSSYQDLISSKHALKLGENQVTISGIVDDDNNLFKEYKNGKDFPDYDFDIYYNETYTALGDIVYVKGFTSAAKLNENKEIVLGQMTITSFMDQIELDKTSEASAYNLKSLKQNIEIITKDGIQSVNSLNKNQVILSINDLKMLDTKYSEGLENYLKQHANEPYNQILNTYTKNYLNSTNFNTLKLKMRKYNFETENTENININVIGVTLEDNSYVSNQYVEEYHPKTKSLDRVYIYDDNIKHLKEVFNNIKFNGVRDFPNGTYYTYSVNHQTDLSNVIGTYQMIYIYVLVVSLIFTLFAILLFSNFIGTSISYCKKEIGILRALGARTQDTLKIFTYESLIIGLISWLASVIGWSYSCTLLNQSLFGGMFYTLNGILKSPIVPIGMFIFTMLIAVLVTFISLNRVNKIKPIDAILNK